MPHRCLCSASSARLAVEHLFTILLRQADYNRSSSKQLLDTSPIQVADHTQQLESSFLKDMHIKTPATALFTTVQHPTFL